MWFLILIPCPRPYLLPPIKRYLKHIHSRCLLLCDVMTLDDRPIALQVFSSPFFLVVNPHALDRLLKKHGIATNYTYGEEIFSSLLQECVAGENERMGELRVGHCTCGDAV